MKRPDRKVGSLPFAPLVAAIACALFESAKGFPIEFLHSATNVMVIRIRASLGIPIEGYGFSRDARGLVGAPAFSAASLPYDGRNLELTIRLHY